MFLTYPHFEQQMPSGLAPQRSRYWRAVELSLRMPWMVLTVVERDDEGGYERTLLLTHASDLEEMLQTRPSRAFQSLRLMAHAALSGIGSGWDSVNVRKVWKIVDAEFGPPGTLVYEDETGRLLDEFGTAPANWPTAPSLLVEFRPNE